MTAKKEETAAPAPNMELWNRLCRTDPKHTKKINQRGGFTAIAAHSQVMAATKAWGPCGGAWGFEFKWIADPDMWVAEVTLRYNILDGRDVLTECRVSQVGASPRGFGGKPDSDAPKKAITDGLTKCFSYTGMNADVFLGLYDDNKYVDEVRREFGLAGKSNGITTGAETLPPRSERTPPPDQARATGKTRIKQLAEKLCGDKDWFEFLQSLAADCGLPMEPDAMNDEQFAHIIAELEGMEQARLADLRAGQPEQGALGIPDGPPMSAYDDDEVTI